MDYNSCRHRHPSVSGDDGVAPICWAYLHFLEWLCRPTREWQSLPHLVQEKGVGCWEYLPRSFRLVLLSKVAVVSASSANFAPYLTVCLQDGRSSAMLSHELLSMLHRFMSLLQTSLKRSLGQPACREPSASLPYKRSLGMHIILLINDYHCLARDIMRLPRKCSFLQEKATISANVR